ncbi:MAG: winged helix-turn-helix domain-containing protein [Candidatus Bathyarchaeia archaeon]
MDGYEAKSYLATIRNVRKGLETRSLIVKALKEGLIDTNAIAEAIGKSYSATLKQLRRMEQDGIVTRTSGKPSIWRLTGRGQQELQPIHLKDPRSLD